MGSTANGGGTAFDAEGRTAHAVADMKMGAHITAPIALDLHLISLLHINSYGLLIPSSPKVTKNDLLSID